jgi:hypothetical protein
MEGQGGGEAQGFADQKQIKPNVSLSCENIFAAQPK